MLEGVIPLETFPLVEWHLGELADVLSLTVLKTQICVTRPQCVKINSSYLLCVKFLHVCVSIQLNMSAQTVFPLSW